MNLKYCFVAGLLVAILGLTIHAEDEAKEKEDAKSKSVEASGVFEAIVAHEIAAKTEQIKSLKIDRIVPHGTRVKKGQAVVWLDTQAIDEQISDAESALNIAEVAYQQFELDYKHAAEIDKLDIAAAKRTRRNAQQDYDNYNKVDHDLEIEATEKDLQEAKFYLEYSEEELKQLEQMYKEDELTEESEEIVLKRVRRAVESAKFRLEREKISASRKTGQTLPRQAEEKKATLDRQLLEYDKSMKAVELAKRKRQLEFDAEKKKIEKKRSDFKKLRDDRQKMVLKSPLDGIVLHGKLTRGKVGAKPSALTKGTTVTDQQVLATIVDPTKLRVRVDLAENLVGKVAVGKKAKVKPTSFPDVEINATVTSLSNAPIMPEKYDCILSIAKKGTKIKLVPAMTCKVVFESAKGNETRKKNAKAK